MKKNKGFQIKVQWDRQGENVEIFSFATKEEAEAFILGVQKGNGWDDSTMEYLDIKPNQDDIQEIVKDLGGVLYDFDNGYNVFECRDMLQGIEDRLKKIAKGV